MSRITKDDVLNAVARLEEAKTDVTVLNLRKDLGRGSYSTISKYLTEHKAVADVPQIDKVTTLPAVTVENLPSELLEWAQKMALDAASFFAHERTQAVESVKVEKNAQIRELAADLEAARSSEAEAIAFSEAQESETELLREQLAGQQDVNKQITDDLHLQIEELKAKVAAEGGKVSALEKANADLLASLPKQRTTTTAKGSK